MKQFRRVVFRLALSVLVVLVLSRASEATTAVMVPDTELIVNSRLIVSGRVVSVRSDWDRSGSLVWTYVEVRSDRILKGELHESTIVLKQLGGTVGERTIRVIGQPDFAAGERVLLYLNTGPDGTLRCAHTFMGKFSIVADPSGTEFVERSVNANELEILGRSDAGEVTNRAPFEAYLEKIQRTLRREAVRVEEVDAARVGQPVVAVPIEFSRSRKHSEGFSPEFVFFGAPVRWMEADSGQPVLYYVNPSASPIAGGATAEITRAMSAWPTQSGATIQLQLAGQTGNCGIVMDNRNTISFGDCLNQMDPPIGCAGVVALTTVSWTNETKVVGGTTFNRLIEADTVFNRGMDCFLANSANLAEVACHELGHSIGLAHSNDPSAIMWATARGQGRDATLGNDDKAGVLAIYPGTPGGGSPPPATPVTITTQGVSEGVEGRSYVATLTATGGTPPYRWTLAGGALPSGLSLSANGTISGVPNFRGTTSFIARVTDASNPTTTDSEWFSLTIRASGGGLLPTVTGIRVKGVKKLWVFGENFRADSLILINGVVFEPRIFAQEGSLGQLLAKGKLKLGPAGTNFVVVINNDSRSAPYVF